MDQNSTNQYSAYSPPPGQQVYQQAPSKGPNLTAIIAVGIVVALAAVAAAFFFVQRGDDRAEGQEVVSQFLALEDQDAIDDFLREYAVDSQAREDIQEQLSPAGSTPRDPDESVKESFQLENPTIIDELNLEQKYAESIFEGSDLEGALRDSHQRVNIALVADEDDQINEDLTYNVYIAYGEQEDGTTELLSVARELG